MLTAYKKIRALQAEIDSISNRERFDDLESVKKAFIAGYGIDNFDSNGWEMNVVSGYVERTRGSSKYRPDEYVTLIIRTKSGMTIRLEYNMFNVDNYEHTIYDQHMKLITNANGNNFEKHLINVLLCNTPYTIYWFEKINLDDIKPFHLKIQDEEDIAISPLI